MFVATAGMAGCATATAALAGKKEIKVAVVGCGGRGTGGMWKPANAQDFYKFGALGNMMQAAEILRGQGIDVTVKPVAFADYFLNKAEFAAEKFGVDKKFAFGGANAYKKIMAMPEVDAVILTTPLNFRPIHTMAAVKAGKHVFAEKGVAVDAPGVRLTIVSFFSPARREASIMRRTPGASSRPKTGRTDVVTDISKSWPLPARESGIFHSKGGRAFSPRSTPPSLTRAASPPVSSSR